jgi:ribonuclease Y
MAFNLLGQAILVFLGIVAGYFVRQSIASRRANSVEERLKAQVDAARSEAKEIIVDAKAQAAEALTKAQEDERERKAQLNRSEERLLKMQESLERELREVASRESEARKGMDRAVELKAEADEARKAASAVLEKTAGMTSHEAREKLFAEVTESSRHDLALSMQKLERERRDEIERRSVEIITTALQRYARGHVSEIASSAFVLPSEDLKGKIIGREGRNIRTLERLTGVEIVIDEHPEAITISSFDPMRRELARMTLEKLIKDGRIQPAKIEEKVEESQAELARRVQEYGEGAAYELGIVDLPKEVLQILGRLHFRTSYGQNVLNHSVEMAHIAGMLAAELGLRVDIAKKGALVHDIGKAIDHEVQGTHVDIGRRILKKYGVEEDVIRAMEAHHEEYPHSIPEAFVVTTADAISGARPGARRDSLEHYFKRLGDLEKIATSFPGVQAAYALSAGREIRVFVTPEKVDDFAALQLAKDVARRIQAELRYPGEIKVNVIRELRAVEYAR